MPIDDPSLLVNILGRDLRAVTKERDDLLRRLEKYESSPSAPDPRIQELQLHNAEISCQVLELETELKQIRETAFGRLSENVEMRNRRARLKRDLQVANSRITELEVSKQDAESQHEDAIQQMEKTLLHTKDELANERRKNAGLKDLVVRITGQRDDALAKLAGIRRMSSVNPAHAPTEVKPLNMKRHIELTDALETPLERNTFDVTTHAEPEETLNAVSESTPIDRDFPDLKYRSRRLNNLKRLPTIDTPPEAVQPVCGPTDDLDSRLQKVSQSKVFNTPYFISESDVEFANPARQHGYTLRPTLVLEPTYNRWAPYTLDTFEPDFPTIFEMFVGSQRGWVYRGTYRRVEQGAMDLPNLTIGEYLDLTAVAKTCLLEQVLRLSSPHEVPSLSDPFASGEVFAQCVGLQCVGFNSDLYHALVSLQSPSERQRFDFGSDDIPMAVDGGRRNVDGERGGATPNGKSSWELSSPPPASPEALIKRFSRIVGHKRGRSTDTTHARSEDDHGLAKRVKQIRTMAQNKFPGAI